MKKILRSVTFWCVSLTLIYLVLSLFEDSRKSSYIVRFIGLFVPIGFANGLFYYLGGYLIPVIIALILVLLTLDYFTINLFRDNFYKKLLYNLIILLAITLILDLIFFHQWTSLILLIHNRNPLDLNP